MTKLVQLTLAKIKYGGDSLGDDIRIEIECLNQSFDINKKIRNGTEVALNAEIGKFFFDQAAAQLPLTIRIIEQDLIFNDVGSAQEKFKVNLKNNASEYLTAVIQIEELRNYTTKKKAIFTITLETQISDVILYVAYQEKGWIWGRREDTKKMIDLVSHLRVRLERSDRARQYFTIMEGALRGVKASIKIATDGTSYLKTENPQTGPVHLMYSLSAKIAHFQNKTYATRDYPNDPEPWKRGVYDIEIPDFSHPGGQYYLPRAKLAKVWFLIGHEGKRYFHPGTFSLGCVTLTEIERWDDLCQILMKARKGDGRSIGTLEIID